MIERIVEYFSLTPWDWFTASVAFLSLVVSLFAFVIAKRTYTVSKKTLISQKQTESNTTPAINIEIQKFLLDELITDFFHIHLKFISLWNVLKSTDYEKTLPESIWKELLLDEKYIHRELFYNDTIAYSAFSDLLNGIKNYNTHILALREYLQIGIHKDLVQFLFNEENKLTQKIILSYCCIKVDYYNDSELNVGRIADFFNFGKKNIDVSKKAKYVDEYDSFFAVRGAVKPSEKEALLDMDEFIENYIKWYTHFLYKKS